jgi:hypothetical protein
MKIILLGTAHPLQRGDPGLRERIEALIQSEHVTLIGEEYNATSVAHQVAACKHVPWIKIDMTDQEREDAGIGTLFCRRALYRAANGLDDEIAIYAPKEDGIREEFWLTKIGNEVTAGPILLICGAAHVPPLTTKATLRGHQVSVVFYPEQLSGLQVRTLPGSE